MGQPETRVEEENGGIKVISEFRTNDDGVRVKVVRKVKLVAHKEKACHAVVVRSKWKRFGAAAKGDGSSFDDGTTVITDEINLRLLTLKELSAGLTDAAVKSASEPAKKPSSVSVVCRVCKGDHWTTKCPYKDTLGSFQELLDTAVPTSAGAAASTSITSTNQPPDQTKKEDSHPSPGKYIPPSMRARMSAGGGATESPASRRMEEENLSLRVSNLSEDATQQDLERLFAPFGPIARCFLPRDRETGQCKGFAFVEYRNRSDAERALKVVNGKGFDNLILKVEWSTPRK